MACVLRYYSNVMSKNRLKKVLFSSILMLLGLGCANNSTKHSRLKRLELEANKLRAIIRVDSMRQAKTTKVLSIMERYNPDMESTRQEDIAEKIVEMALKYENLDVNLLCATITHESARDWDPTAVSHAGAMGLMQIMPSTGEWLARSQGLKWTTPREILFDPILNIRLGSHYLSRLIGAYDLEAGLAAYNGGMRRTEKWLDKNKEDDILPDETAKYIPLVLTLYDQFNNSTL